MKRRLITCVTIILFAIICITNTSLANSYEPPLLSGNLLWNIESYRYYVDSTATPYLTPIANAANNWVYTGYGYNRLYPNTRTTNIASSAVDIYAYNQSDLGNARTFFFARTNGTTGNAYLVDPNVSNWLFNEIKLNIGYISNKSSTAQQGVVAHEFGHAFGLDENNANPESIMCQSSSGRSVYTVQQVDNNAFNRKYP